MNKNVKRIFFVLTLVTLLATVGAVCAADDTNSTTTTDNNLSDATTVSKYDNIEKISEVSDNNRTTVKNLEKKDKDIKTATKTVTVSNYDELTSAINSAVEDANNDEYIINLDEGTYTITKTTTYNKGSYTPNIIINANGQTLTSNNKKRYIQYENGCNITINNATITHSIRNYVNLKLNDTTITSEIRNNADSTITASNTTFSSKFINSGMLILEEGVELTSGFEISGTGEIISENANIIYPYVNKFMGNNTLHDLTIDKIIINYGNLTLINITINQKIINSGKLIISDDTIFNSNCLIEGDGDIEINDTNKLAPYLITYKGNYTLSNITITNDKTNLKNLTITDCIINSNINNQMDANLNIFNSTINDNIHNEGNLTFENSKINEKLTNTGNLTINNSLVNSTINNYGILIIDDKTVFTENTEINEYGEIITNNITKLLPYLSNINGNYTITDTTINKSYIFNGNITLENCTITSTNNINYAVLNIKNTNVQIEEDKTWITNYGVIIIKNSNIKGNIINYKEVYNENLPENYTYDNTYHIVNNDTVKDIFSSIGKSEYAYNNFDTNTLNIKINKGDTLDFQGTITGNYNLTINKPVNIISSTNDAVISLNTTCANLVGDNPGNSFSIISGGSYTNITNITFYNTQLFVINSTHVMLDHINATVIGNPVGGGVGQTSIRENSSYITVKNSYFYTENNGGSSTFVLAWADHCKIINNTVNAGEGAGNLFYFTTYNVNVPIGIEANSFNEVINNTIGELNGTYGGIQAPCLLTGTNNTLIGNIIPSVGTQFFTGNCKNTIIYNNTIGEIIALSGYLIENNNIHENIAIFEDNITINNNNISGNIIINAESEFSTINNLIIKNNNCSINISKVSNKIISENNIINLTITRNTANITVENCNISGIITLDKGASKNNIQYNNITSDIIINGEENILTNNKITNNNTYAINGKGTNNIITKNYLKTPYSYGNNSVNLTKETNTVENNLPKIELTIITTLFTPKNNATIKASISLENETMTDLSKGKVTFKVNGKTLKDANGKVIYAKIVNGTATIENYVVPDDWAKEGTTIQAVYSGSTQCEKLTSEKTNITVEKAAPTFTTESVTGAAGTTIQLTATITDGDKVINTGKVVFKINGKTVKDTNGKVIYAKIVNNQVIVNYTLPVDMKAKEYNITATFISSDYERLEDTKTLTVTA